MTSDKWLTSTTLQIEVADLTFSQSDWRNLMVDQLIADYVIEVLKCVEERKRVNQRLTVPIKLISNYVIED